MNTNSTSSLPPGPILDPVVCPVLDNITVAEIPSPYWNIKTTVPLYVGLIIFPLLNFKNASFFTKFNSLGTLSVLYLVCFVSVKGWEWGAHVATWGAELAPHADAGVLSGMLALSFYIHNIIISIMRGNRQQCHNGRDLSIAFGLVTLTYILVGSVFYICFPLAKSCIQDNILNNFEKHDVLTAVARILLLFQVVTVFPLVAFMVRSQILDLLPLKVNTWHIIGVNLGIVVMCILFACFCPKIGTIIRYTGAMSGLVHVFVLPSLLQVRSLAKRGRLTCLAALFYFAIFLIGAANLLAQFFVAD